MGYFTVQELCKSETARIYRIDNTPTKEIENHLKELIQFLDPIRQKWGSSIRINSGYRCPKLNNHPKVRGSKTSVHMIGYAADLWPVNGRFDDFCKFMGDYLKDKKFDQCIIERNYSGSRWVHIGLYNNAGAQRKMIFSQNKI